MTRQSPPTRSARGRGSRCQAQHRASVLTVRPPGPAGVGRHPPQGDLHVDRFFSKLDLRDIKIDPFRTSFPPDGDDDALDAPADLPAPAVDDAGANGWAHPERRPHVPAWAAPVAGVAANGVAANG